MNDSVETIYVIDELELRPGRIEEFLDAFENHYCPGAAARGMQRLHTWVTPPEGPPEEGATLIVVWGLAGVPGFWAMRSQNGSPEVAAWWRRCEEFVVRRTRRFAVEPGSRSAFAAAGRLHA